MNSNNPLNGLSYLTDGFKLIFKPGIKRYVIVPLIINTLVFIGMFVLAKHYFQIFNYWMMGLLPSWLHWLGAIFWFLFLTMYFFIFIYTFTTLANIISAPFNSFLAEKVELHLVGKTAADRSFWEILKDTPRIIGRQLSILGYYIPRALLLLVLFFIPIIHFIAVFLWFLFNAWFMSLQFLDYHTDNHQIPLNKVKDWMRQNRGPVLVLGSGVLLLSMIPVLNLLILPAAVAGATKMWIVEERRDKFH